MKKSSDVVTVHRIKESTSEAIRKLMQHLKLEESKQLGKA